MIYLAGPYDSEHRTLMVQVAAQLRRNSIEIYCPWEQKIENAWGLTQEKWARQVFTLDTAAIQNCNAMIVISEGKTASWEQGYAFALNKPIHVVQIGDAPASLITYCGCKTFIARSVKELESSILWIVDNLKNENTRLFKRPSDVILI